MSWRALSAAVAILLLPASASAAIPTPGPDSSVIPATSPTGSTATAPSLFGDAFELSSARRAPQWYTEYQNSGPTQNCILQTPEQLGAAWAGWYGDIGVSPQVNNVYYVMVGWGISGNPCTGGAGVHNELMLPAYTKLAISNNNKVHCYYKKPSSAGDPVQFTADCPQSPQVGLYGGYSFDPPGAQGPWPTAVGAIFEIYVPVKTTQPLNGIESAEGTPCYTCLYAGVWLIDGWNSPWVWPRQGVYVVGDGSTPTAPLVTYPGPSISGVSYYTPEKKILAQLNGNIFRSGPGGQAYYEFGDRAGTYPNEPGPRLNIGPADDWLVYKDFLFPPGNDFHWRFCFKPTGSPPICGRDQLYQAPPQTGIQEVKVKKRKATATFDSEPVPSMIAKFQCKLDRGKFKSCSSPKVYKNLARGKHTFSVRAVDQHGHKDSTPEKQTFKV